MDVAALEERIEGLVAPIVASLGMEVVDVEYTRVSGRNVLRLYVDFPQGGVTIADCVKASRSVEGVLDVDGDLPSAYDLEVSSPGLNRRLRKVHEFERCIGRIIDVKTKAPIDGRAHYKGCLKAATEAEINVEIDKRVWKIPVSQIAKARLRYFEKV